MASIQEPQGTVNKEQGASVVTEQDRFYYDKLGYLILLSLLLLVLAVGVGGLIFLLRSSAVPPPTIFKVSALDQLIQEPPLDEAGIDPSVLLNWLTEAMMVSNTFNFINYSTVISNVSIYFTPEGYDSYKKALSDAKITDRILDKKLVLKSTATDAPQILLEKPFAGRYLWKIKIPMSLKYQNVTTETTDRAEINVIVMRVPTTQSPLGVLILKYEMSVQSQG